MQYVAGVDPDILMPPSDSRLARLNQEEVGLVRAWIDQGAIWPKDEKPEVVSTKKDPSKHWSFHRPERAELPDVHVKDWPKNAIDFFILARLEEAGLAPEAEADRTTLIRRLSLDLTGLPPTTEEVQAFVNDRSERAYENLVERLLESPHYGERWALWWLDIARYADTNGYEVDRPRSVWPYRDWVVSAFNSRMPFNQFVIEQMAGDLLPNATQQQRIATGFHRNTFYNEEGGHDAEQFRWEAIVDRASTTGTAFLGLTVGCAQCHNHKYDPISHTEFYEFFAFLNNDDEPHLEVPQAAITTKREKLLAEINALESKLENEFPIDEKELAGGAGAPEERRQQAVDAKFEAWRTEAEKTTRKWVLLEPIKWVSKGEQTLTKLEDGSLLASGDRPETDSFEIVYRSPISKITGIRLEALPDASLPNYGPGRGYFADDGTFLLSEFSVSATEAIKLRNPSATITKKSKNSIEKTLDGNKLTGWHIGGGVGQRQCAVYETDGSVSLPENGELTVTLLQNYVHAQTIGRFRMWVTEGEYPLSASDMSIEVEQTLLKPVEEWSVAEREAAKRYFLLHTPELKRQQAAIAKRRQQLPAQPTTLVLEERRTPRVSHQHIRGDFRRPGPEVTPNVPRFLHPLPEGPRNRLTLARWLVDEQNPLIGRVVMNQIWQSYFGRGFVNTPEDFGTEGAAPSHPELLDWLACEFLECGWDLRHMHRLIVTSAAYRQSSAVSSEKLQADPENILVSRGARFRLHAEFIRDVALHASGLLNPELGGPSVFPSQPAGVTELSFSKFPWPTSTGTDRYRRALYTFRKRSAMYAAFSLFDSPPQNACAMRRIRSNTPLQGLALLNDSAMNEAAQTLAAKTVKEGPKDDEGKLGYIFERCVTRRPNSEEALTMQAFLVGQREQLSADVNRAMQVAGIGECENCVKEAIVERATWTMVARAILTLDETISKE